MRIVLTFIKIAFLALALFVLVNNANQFVTIRLLTETFHEVNLVVVIIVSITIGAVLGAALMAFNVIQSGSRMKQLQYKNRQLTQELENMRNVSIEDIAVEHIDTPAALPEKALPSDDKQ